MAADGKLTDQDTPLLVVITGPPASGKSTLASALSVEVSLPCISRDAFKEILFEELGWSDRARSQRLGRATWPLLYNVVGEQLRAGRSLIVEANFDPTLDAAEFVRLPAFRALQIYCTATPEVDPRAVRRPCPRQQPPSRPRRRLDLGRDHRRSGG